MLWLNTAETVYTEEPRLSKPQGMYTIWLDNQGVQVNKGEFPNNLQYSQKIVEHEKSSFNWSLWGQILEYLMYFWLVSQYNMTPWTFNRKAVVLVLFSSDKTAYHLCRSDQQPVCFIFDLDLKFVFALCWHFISDYIRKPTQNTHNSPATHNPDHKPLPYHSQPLST